VQAFRDWKADKIIGEQNFGGAMVEHTIRTVYKNAPLKLVHASRGKVQRAEPVASLYSQGKVRHVGFYAELERQMGLFSTSGYKGARSPDRADAMVWAFTELMVGFVPDPARRINVPIRR
jgi:phage terminase large subunit-like protein